MQDSSNVVALPRPRAPMHWVRLARLDGTPWHSAGFLPGLASAPWTWIVETVAHELDVPEDSVGCAETDDGDIVTVDGLPAYRIRC